MTCENNVFIAPRHFTQASECKNDYFTALEGGDDAH